MDTKLIHEMVKVLRPVIKDKARAEALLTRYWQDKDALIWKVEHVYRAANEIKFALTRAEAIEILHNFCRTHNRQYGLCWSDLTETIKDQVLGRDLTKAELRRFVHRDIITINQ